MPDFRVEVPHQVARDVASKKLRAHSEIAREKMPVEVSDVNETWDEHGNLDFSFKALGFKVSGQMVAGENNVVVSGKIPFAALPFRGMIENQLVARINEALAMPG